MRVTCMHAFRAQKAARASAVAVIMTKEADCDFANLHHGICSLACERLDWSTNHMMRMDHGCYTTTERSVDRMLRMNH